MGIVIYGFKTWLALEHIKIIGLLGTCCISQFKLQLVVKIVIQINFKIKCPLHWQMCDLIVTLLSHETSVRLLKIALCAPMNELDFCDWTIEISNLLVAQVFI